jgi:hypothetical protein
MTTKETTAKIVKYSNPGAGEADFRFFLLDVCDDRATLQLICDETVKPIEVVHPSEICDA